MTHGGTEGLLEPSPIRPVRLSTPLAPPHQALGPEAPPNMHQSCRYVLGQPWSRLSFGRDIMCCCHECGSPVREGPRHSPLARGPKRAKQSTRQFVATPPDLDPGRRVG
jgi:hypothetical protein